jgi:hypothetical protein
MKNVLSFVGVVDVAVGVVVEVVVVVDVNVSDVRNETFLRCVWPPFVSGC